MHIRGSHLYGLNNQKLGKIEDVIFDHRSGNIHYVVVDTGGWLTSKKFLVPGLALLVSAKHSNAFEANLDKREDESFPPYNESDLDSESKWAGYERRHRSKWVADPVMHRAETDRNITLTSRQIRRKSRLGASCRPSSQTVVRLTPPGPYHCGQSRS
jgi:PRC-barrel domain